MTGWDITEDDAKRFEHLLSFLTRLAADGVSPLIEKQVITMLDQSLPFFSHLLYKDSFTELTRISINKKVLGKNQRIKEIKYLHYPPPDKVKAYGRCNLPGQSALYATFNLLTAFGEMKPALGDLVTVSKWVLRVPDTPMLFCPIFKNQPVRDNVYNPRTRQFDLLYQQKLASFPKHVARQIDALTQFIADAFTRRVKPQNDLDYIFSAYFSNKILNEFEAGSIDAIYYPSVPGDLSFENIAIKPAVFDRLYRIDEVSDAIVVTTPENGRGGYFRNGLGHCRGFNFLTGEILWDPKDLETNQDTILDLKWRQGFDFALE
jgi:hypothetical protein